jgi:hypothetical protein
MHNCSEQSGKRKKGENEKQKSIYIHTSKKKKKQEELFSYRTKRRVDILAIDNGCRTSGNRKRHE